MAVFRNEKKTNYTTVDNNIFKNTKLSLKAKGMLCTLLSLPSTWNFSEAGLCKLSSDSRTVIRSALQELIQNGYLTRTQSKEDGGKFGEMIYTIYDEPTVVTKTDNGKTDIGKKTQYNNIINNTKYTSNTKDIINTKVNNNKIINNLIIKENNISKDILKEKKKFVPPTLEEVQSYIKEKNYSVDPKVFFDYFNESNWVDANGNKVKNWKQKVITWNSRNQSRNKNNYKTKKSFEETYDPFRE